MRNLLIGGVIGLVLGVLGAFGYSHYLGEGRQLAQVQADLASAQKSLAKSTDYVQYLKSETHALSAQVEQLASKNEQLKTEVAANPAGEASPAPNPMAGMMKAAVNQQYQQKLQLLKARLHLTPEQEAAVQAAMDEESKGAAEMASLALQGGKIDPQAMKNVPGFGALEKTLNDILTPDQKTAYAQLQSDEKNSTTETVAAIEMNQLTPVLQLSDAQKDQVYSALYQVQQNSTDPTWIKNNMPHGSSAEAFLDAQAKAKDDALAAILSPEQMTLYRQQAQSQLNIQKAMVQKFTPAVSGGTVTSVTVTPGP